MRRILLILVVIFGFSSCGPHMYNTLSAGKDNSSFIIVLTAGRPYENVSVVVDGELFAVNKIYKVKATRKAHPITIAPGKHNVKVMSGDRILVDENIFLGVQETKKIVLR